MKVTYDKRADAANFVFQKGRYHISKEIGEGVIVDYTKSGKILSIEILDFSKRMPKGNVKNTLTSQKVELTAMS